MQDSNKKTLKLILDADQLFIAVCCPAISPKNSKQKTMYTKFVFLFMNITAFPENNVPKYQFNAG